MLSSNEAIRQQALKSRSSMTSEQCKAASQDICDRLFDLFRGDFGSQSHCILSYYPIKNEADLWDFHENMIIQGERIFFPVVDGLDMNFYHADDKKGFAPGSFACFEPVDRSIPYKKDTPAVVLVPGVAFSESGDRLGYGKGYYDRFLSDAANIVKKIGVCYESQLFNDIKPESTDIPMDIIITEKRIIRP